MSEEALRDEVTELCRDLIRIDTSNPPGRETPAAELLAGYLEAAGVACELVGPDPDRLNLIARLEGTGKGPSLMLLGHTDVVPAPSHGWSVPPFEGAVADGSIVGRGAADMKGELAARAVALASRARRNEVPAGDIVLIAEADEEANVSDVGITWLVRERPDIRCDYALNEGGGSLLELADGRRLVTVGIGEKVVCSVRLRLSGRGGHASTPLGTENPLEHASEAIRRLTAARAPRRPVPAVAAALEQLGVAELGDEELIVWAREQHPLLAADLDAMLRLTVTPTGVNTYEPANVIPPYVDITCDCRALPGGDLAEIEAHIEAALEGGPTYELELLEPLEGGTSSPAEGPLYEAIEAWTAGRLPDATLLPIVSTGFNDSAFVRQAFGTVAYGFAPVFVTDPAVYYGGIHSADEQIALDDLAAMTSLNLAAIDAIAGAPAQRRARQPRVRE